MVSQKKGKAKATDGKGPQGKGVVNDTKNTSGGDDAGGKKSKKKEEEEDKRKADLARKAENARLLAEEEAGLAKTQKGKPTKKEKGSPPKKENGAPSHPDKSKDSLPAKVDDEQVESFAATGIDDALNLLGTVTAKKDKASMGQQAAELDAHPERRFKAAFEAYQESELPNIRRDHPGLRLQQYKDLLYKQFQKAPENPFNQVSVDYNATKKDRVGALAEQHARVLHDLRK